MKSKICLWVIVSVIAIALATAAWVVTRPHHPVGPVSARAERVAAELALAEKLSGPRYFAAPAGVKPEEDGLWIDAREAWPQVPRITAARNLDPEATKTLGRLIEKLCEPHPNRAVGGDRINLSRLNLSLDSIK